MVSNRRGLDLRVQRHAGLPLPERQERSTRAGRTAHRGSQHRGREPYVHLRETERRPSPHAGRSTAQRGRTRQRQQIQHISPDGHHSDSVPRAIRRHQRRGRTNRNPSRVRHEWPIGNPAVHPENNLRRLRPVRRPRRLPVKQPLDGRESLRDLRRTHGSTANIIAMDGCHRRRPTVVSRHTNGHNAQVHRLRRTARGGLARRRHEGQQHVLRDVRRICTVRSSHSGFQDSARLQDVARRRRQQPERQYVPLARHINTRPARFGRRRK